MSPQYPQLAVHHGALKQTVTLASPNPNGTQYGFGPEEPGKNPMQVQGEHAQDGNLADTADPISHSENCFQNCVSVLKRCKCLSTKTSHQFSQFHSGERSALDFHFEGEQHFWEDKHKTKLQ